MYIYIWIPSINIYPYLSSSMLFPKASRKRLSLAEKETATALHRSICPLDVRNVQRGGEAAEAARARADVPVLMDQLADLFPVKTASLSELHPRSP